jgi:general stress protein 26
MTEVRTPVEQLNELVRGIQFAMFTTIHVDGSPHSCPMATQEADAGGHLWFFTRTDTSKMLALRDNKNVCVAYADAGTERYVSVTGIGELIRNEAKARELWNPLYKAWFPHGLDDPNLILIRVLITDAEHWSAAQGKMVRIVGFSKGAIAAEEYPSTSSRDL